MLSLSDNILFSLYAFYCNSEHFMVYSVLAITTITVVNIVIIIKNSSST